MGSVTESRASCGGCARAGRAPQQQQQQQPCITGPGTAPSQLWHCVLTEAHKQENENGSFYISSVHTR